MTKERDIYQQFLDGEMSSSRFRQETAKRWRKYVSESRTREKDSIVAPQNPKEKVVK